jgi:hypothetical protein
MKKLITFFVIILLLGSTSSPVLAQDYYFSVDKEDVTLTINSDGTATVDYTWVFTNGSGSPSIEYVDAALPTADFSMASVKAFVKNQPVTNFYAWSDIGITLDLGGLSIPPGETATVSLHVEGIKGLIYTSDQKLSEPYASVQFSPQYFGSQYVYGSTDITVILALPPGLTENDQPTYYNPTNWPGTTDPTQSYYKDGRLYYMWEGTGNSYSEYKFGTSFPARLVPAEVVQKPPLINIKIDPEALIGICIVGGFFSIFLGGGLLGYFADKRRRMQYLPPKIAIEGNGIKRGLTAVEAAILMEQPMDKILTMILFGTIKKEAAQVVNKDPLTLEFAKLPVENLNPYETDFLAAFKEADPSGRKRLLQTTMVNLVNSISEKMRGFSRKETIAYYDSIMKKAWEQVQAAETPEVQMEKFGEAMEWTMLDRNFDDRTRDIFSRPGPVYAPYWWGHFDPVYRSSSVPSMPSAPSVHRPIQISVPSLPGSNFAASVVNGITGFSSQAVGNVTGFTGNITNKTNPVPVSTSSYRSGGSSSGGGRSCACACACAGCACACAGGGR